MLAFSSIGQLGMVFIAFSAGFDRHWRAGAALHHLVVKSGTCSRRAGSPHASGLGLRSRAIYVPSSPVMKPESHVPSGSTADRLVALAQAR
jgi:hypothetical protein